MATQPKRKIECSEAEWQARQELAACYRVFDHLGWSESIYNHISLKVPGEEGAFLINPYGLLYSEVCASNLVKIDIDGNTLDGSPYPVNKAGSPSTPISIATSIGPTRSATPTPPRPWRYVRWKAGCSRSTSMPATLSAG